MKPKILLVNYSKSESDAVAKDTGLKILRGYLSEGNGTVGEGSKKRQKIKFYSPEAYYECAMVFVKIPTSPKLEEEFGGLAKVLSEDDQNNFKSYWKSRKQLLIFFVGDTNIGSLWNFNVPVVLEKSSGNDTTTQTWLKEEHGLFEIVEQINSSLKMPTARYIESGFKEQPGANPYYSYGTKWTSYVTNVNEDSLAIALSKDNDDYSYDNPGVYVVGLPKKISTLTTKMIRFFGEYFEMFAVGDDWKNSDEFYPSETLEVLKDNINSIIATAEQDIKAKNQEIDDIKDKYSFLADLIKEQGTPLVSAVKQALEEIFGLDVVDSDEETEGEPIEDLFVTLNPVRQISIEVKGTTKPTPPLEYTQQPFQHITRRGYGKSVEAALILNHDMNKYPPQRVNAYGDTDKEPLIANLHFIDTRVLLRVANEVVDGNITKEVGTEILFNKFGRVTYEPEVDKSTEVK